MLYLKILVTAGRFSGIWHYPWLSLSWLLPQSQLKRSSSIEWYLHSHASLWVRAAWFCIYCESRFLFQIEITILQRFCKITYSHLILLKMFNLNKLIFDWMIQWLIHSACFITEWSALLKDSMTTFLAAHCNLQTLFEAKMTFKRWFAPFWSLSDTSVLIS